MLTPKAGVPEVELLLMLFGVPEFGDPAALPLSELLTPGVP